MLLQAHRGVSTEFPENTMPAFEAAWQQGYPYIELDPKFTADGECVVFHDKTINRTCRNPDGSVIAETINASDLTLAQLQSYDAGLFMGEKFRGTRVPLLSQVLAFAKAHQLKVKIDNRFCVWPEAYQNRLFDIVQASGFSADFTCLNIPSVRKVLERFPKATIHYDGPVDEETLRQIKGLLSDNRLIIWLPLPSERTSWVKVPMATPELCQMVKKYGALGIWILHTQEEALQAQALGADIIETTGGVKPAQLL